MQSREASLHADAGLRGKIGDIAVVCSQLLVLSDLSCPENCYPRRSSQENPKMEGNSDQEVDLFIV